MAVKKSSTPKHTASTAVKVTVKGVLAPSKAGGFSRAKAATLRTAVKGPALPDLPKPPKLSPEESRARLQRLGIITASGELTELYR